MTNEEILKEMISKRYQSLKDFSEKINLPYTTVRSILERGLLNAKVENVVKIADELNMRAEDMLLLSEKENLNRDLHLYFEKLDKDKKMEVIAFAKRKLDEQNKIIAFSRLVKIYASVSAGTGEWLEYENIEEVEYDGDLPDYDYAVRVNGDSMQPMFEDDDIVFVKKQDYLSNGAIMIIVVDNEAYIKKVRVDGGQLRLVSLNPKYKDIIVKQSDNVRIIGKVIYA